MMGKGRLTTHVLDTASGKPASGLKITLYIVKSAAKAGGLEKIKSVTTNSDGRCDAPLLAAKTMKKGAYELHFQAGDYFKKIGVELTKPAFLDVVPIRFGIADVDAHYHVPLLISPYGYSTYRGS